LGDLLTCDAVAAQGMIERYLAGKLSEAEAEAFEAHYLNCSPCQRELRLAVAIRDGLRRAPPGRREAEGGEEGRG
jgi:anti-sigma factor RsiW